MEPKLALMGGLSGFLWVLLSMITLAVACAGGGQWETHCWGLAGLFVVLGKGLQNAGCYFVKHLEARMAVCQWRQGGHYCGWWVNVRCMLRHIPAGPGMWGVELLTAASVFTPLVRWPVPDLQASCCG